MAQPKVARWRGQKTYRLVWGDPETGKTRRRDTGCRTRADAERYLTAWLQGSIPGSGAAAPVGGSGGAPDTTLDGLCEAYLTRKKAVQTGRGAAGAESQRVNLAVIRRVWGARLVSDVTSKDMERLRDQLVSEGREPSTARRYISALIACVNWGVSAQLVSDDVRRGMFAGFSLPPSGEAQTLWLPRKERDFLWNYCLGLVQARSKQWRAAGAVCLALSTAARREALLGLTWDRVHLGEERVIDFRDPKRARSNKRRVALPISTETGQVLDALLEINRACAVGGAPSPFVLGNTGPIRWGFQQIRDRAGFPDLQFKTLRATWASLAAQRGVDLRVIADVLGDDMETTRKHYAHLHPAHLRDAFE